MTFQRCTTLAMALALLAGSAAPAFADINLLNVSYDPTRELYQDFNKGFAIGWHLPGN